MFLTDRFKYYYQISCQAICIKMEEDQRECPNCGTVLEEGELECSSCGESFIDEDEPL